VVLMATKFGQSCSIAQRPELMALLECIHCLKELQVWDDGWEFAVVVAAHAEMLVSEFAGHAAVLLVLLS